MPLLAYGADGAEFRAWAMPPAAWEALKAGYRDKGIAAACCGAAVIPVRSPTGWQFFRHKPGSGCRVRESLAHVACKSIMARVADRLGFDVVTEARADDGAWVADVLVRCLGWTAALEVQLSRIPLAAMEERQARYRKAGIRGAWLVGFDGAKLDARRDLPMFRVEVGDGERIEPVVVLPAADGTPARIALARFTEQLLTGGVRFHGPPVQASAPSVASVPSVCWRCRRDIDLAVALVNVPAHALFAPRGIVPAQDLGKHPEAVAAYRKALPTLLAACGSLTPLRRPPPARIAAGMRAHCPWCDTPISLRRLPAATLAPGAWRRCWTLAGEPWEPAGPSTPRWTWGGRGEET